MDLTHLTAPGDLLWAQAAFDAIQGIMAGTFDLSNAYLQFSFLVLPQLTVSGAHGNNDVFVSLKIDNFGVLTWPGGTFDLGELPTNRITDIFAHETVGGVAIQPWLIFGRMDLSFQSLFRATSVTALERVIFNGDDQIGYGGSVRDKTDDILHSWDGEDVIYATNSGGHDRLYGDRGNDRMQHAEQHRCGAICPRLDKGLWRRRR